MCNSRFKTKAQLALVFAAFCILSASPAAAHQIYFNNFETLPIGSEWSNTSTDTTPSGRNFLGQFDNDTVSLTLTSVPACNVTVSFELFLIQSWDGNGDHCCGPDVFDVSIGGGPELLHTTFANVAPDYTLQAYPDAYPGGLNEERTGAAENNTLGYTFHGDSVYNLSFTFAHSGGDLVVDFSASGLQDIGDESWGLDNVLVEVEKKVDINIKPGSDPNPVNPDSKGLTPVAILSSPEFDATTVDPSTVELAGAPVAVRGKNKLMAHEEDVNGDGLPDLVVHVETQDLDLPDGGTVELMLTGTTFGGEDIVGYDVVVIVPQEKLPVLVETLTVYANDLDGEDSTEDLVDGVDYRIEVSGTWTNKAGGSDAFAVDAEYVSYDGWINWQDGPDPIPEEPGERKNQLDLQVDQNCVDWGEFSSDHTYSIDLAGSGSTVNFRVYDGLLSLGPEPGWYPDNDGSLTVTIYRLP